MVHVKEPFNRFGLVVNVSSPDSGADWLFKNFLPLIRMTESNITMKSDSQAESNWTQSFVSRIMHTHSILLILNGNTMAISVWNISESQLPVFKLLSLNVICSVESKFVKHVSIFCFFIPHEKRQQTSCNILEACDSQFSRPAEEIKRETYFKTQTQFMVKNQDRVCYFFVSFW